MLLVMEVGMLCKRWCLVSLISGVKVLDVGCTDVDDRRSV
jgi:hypothetical protein